MTGEDLLLRGGRVGLSGPRADVLVRGGRVTAIADVGTVDPVGVEVLALPNATVLPGLVDAHVHVDQWVHRSRRVDVASAQCVGDVVEALRSDPASLDGSGAVRVLTGHGFVDALWPEPPHKALLDEAFGVRPVAVVSLDLHTAWLSSAALGLVGRAGHPTGILREQDCTDSVRALMDLEPDEVVDRWVQDALATAAGRGVTGVVDFEHADNLAVWSRRASRGDLPMRVAASVWRPWFDAAVEAGRRTGDPLPGTGGLVSVGPLKLVADGSLNTRTAHCHEPYAEASPGEELGLELLDRDELVSWMTRAVDAGLEPAVHAIGDAANTATLDAFEKVGCAGRIEHAQLLRTSDLPRFAANSVIASVQPQHAVIDRDVADRHWKGRTDRAFAFAALHAAGAELRLGSDAPVSPLDPWEAVADAVARTADDRPPWHPEQGLPLDVALAAACDGRRVPKVGEPADLVVVAGDLAQSTLDQVRSTTVLATLLGGRFTHRAC